MVKHSDTRVRGSQPAQSSFDVTRYLRGVQAALRTENRPMVLGTGGLAATALAALVLGLLGLFALSQPDMALDERQPLLGAVRLLTTLPLILLFGLIVAAWRLIPSGLSHGLALMLASLATWIGFEASADLYGEVQQNEWLELAFSSVAVLGMLICLISAARLALLERGPGERDALTGLLNREGFARRYAKLPEGTAVTLVMIDLNDLKSVNDLQGHSAGDAHIAKVARTFSSLPGVLAAARWGGDEFALLLSDDLAAARRKLSDLAIQLDEAAATPAFALGVAAVTACEPLERALALADADLYQCKEAQRLHQSQLGQHGFNLGLEAFSEQLERLDAPEAVIEEGLKMTRDLLGFKTAFFANLEGDALRPKTVIGDMRQEVTALLGSRRYGPATGVVGQAIASRQAAWADDYPAHPVALPEWTAAGLKSMVAVPVLHRGELVGLLCLMSFHAWRPVTPQTRQLLEAVALRLGHALERAESLGELRQTLEGSLLTLGVALEARDLETSGHTERVVALSRALGSALGLSENQLTDLRYGAYLHDIGKLAVPDAILLKPGKLEPGEWKLMKAHSIRGFELAQRIPSLSRGALEVIRHHHEHWDGAGYPDGISGEAIPLLARVFAVCDVYDALTSERPYKRAWSPQAALAEIGAQADRQFDPRVARTFARLQGARLRERETASAPPG